MAPGEVVPPRLVIHVNMSDLDRIEPSPHPVPYPWSEVLTRLAYTELIVHLTISELVNLAMKHEPAWRPVRAFFGTTEDPGAPQPPDIINPNPLFIQLTDVEKVRSGYSAAKRRPCYVLQDSTGLSEPPRDPHNKTSHTLKRMIIR